MSHWQQSGDQRPLQKYAADAQDRDTRASQSGGGGAPSIPRSNQYVFSTTSASPSPRRQQHPSVTTPHQQSPSSRTQLENRHHQHSGNHTMSRMDHSGLNDSTDAIAAPVTTRHRNTATQDTYSSNDRPSWMTPPTQQQQYDNHTATDNYFNRPAVAGDAKRTTSPYRHQHLSSSVSGFVSTSSALMMGGPPIDLSAVSPVPSSVESFLSLHDRTINHNSTAASRNKKNVPPQGRGDGLVKKSNSLNSHFSSSVSGSWLRRAGSVDGPNNTKSINDEFGVEGWVRRPDEHFHLGPGDGDLPISRFLSPSSRADPFLQQHQDRWATSGRSGDIAHYSEEDDDDDDSPTGGGLLYTTIIRPIEVKLLKYVLSAPVTTASQSTQKAGTSGGRRQTSPAVDPAEIDNKYWADNLQSRLKKDATGIRPLFGEECSGGPTAASHHTHTKEEALGSLFDSMVDYFTKRRFEKPSSSLLTSAKKLRKVGHLKTGGKPKTIAQRSPLLAVLGEGYVPDLGSSLVKLGVSLVVCHLTVAYTLLWVF